MITQGQIQWPVFLIEGRDVIVARDPIRFMQRFEDIDIRGGGYELLDSIGQIVVIDWHKPNRFGQDRYSFGVSSSRADPERLASALRYFLRDAKPSISSNAPLSSLVQRMCIADRGE
jgi:hypothetical protein